MSFRDTLNGKTRLWASLLVGLCCTAIAGEWPRWRGPGCDGSAPPGRYPVKWAPAEVAWKAPLPGKGCSTPVVLNRRIYLTAPVNGLDAVLAFDLNGKLLWKTTFGPEEPGRHPNASGCNPSPVTDGSGVFVFFKSGTFAAVEPNGTVRWRFNLIERFGPERRFWDLGTSPVLTKEHVVFARMHDGDSWVAAFDKKTGAMAWKVPRNYETPTEGRQAYTTPIVLTRGGKERILVWGAHRLTIHDAANGNIIWFCGGFNLEGKRMWPSVATPVVSGDMVIVPCGRADRGQPRLHGIRLGGRGDVTKNNRVWKRTDAGTFVPSPAAHKGRVYVLSDFGEINCIDPATGKDIWRGKFPRGRGKFYASPLIAGGHLYAVRERGTLYVVRLGEAFQLESQIDLSEKVIASPIAVWNRILIRTDRHLWCIASNVE